MTSSSLLNTNGLSTDRSRSNVENLTVLILILNNCVAEYRIISSVERYNAVGVGLRTIYVSELAAVSEFGSIQVGVNIEGVAYVEGLGLGLTVEAVDRDSSVLRSLGRSLSRAQSGSEPRAGSAQSEPRSVGGRSLGAGVGLGASVGASVGLTGLLKVMNSSPSPSLSSLISPLLMI